MNMNRIEFAARSALQTYLARRWAVVGDLLILTALAVWIAL